MNGAVWFGLAIGLVSCASLPAKPLQTEPLDFSDVEAAVLVADMVSVMARDWPPAHTRLAISPATSLAEPLETRLRTAGYALVVGEGLHQVVELRAGRIGGLPAFRLGLRVGRDWQLDRRYARDATGELRPASGFTLKGGRGVRGPLEPLGYELRADEREAEAVELARAWQVELKTGVRVQPLADRKRDLDKLGLPAFVIDLGDVHALRVGPFKSVAKARDVAAMLRVAGYDEAAILDVSEARIGRVDSEGEAGESSADEGPCANIRVEAGSLRVNAGRLLEECGYRLGHWRLGDGAEFEDLIIPVGYEVQVEGKVWGLLAFLEEAYGVRGRVRELDGAVDFESLEDQL